MRRNKLMITFLSSANKNKALSVWGLIIVLAVALMFVRYDAAAGQAPVALASAAKVAVLAATTVTTTAGRQVILSGGAKAANIYWQVGSSATLGTTSVFKGNILASTSITVQNGAAVEGRLLARTAAVTFDTNIITPPAP